MKNIIISLLFAFAPMWICHAGAVKDFEIKVVEQLGRDIYEQDIIAAEATDVLFSQDLNLSEFPVRGWIVEKKREESVVTFVGEYGGGFYGLFEVVKSGKKKASFRELDKVPLTEDQCAVFRARSLALHNIEEPCSDRYNFVVLRNPSGRGFLVYGLAATTDPDAVLVGGHYRFAITEDGKTIESSERLSNSCLTLDKTPEDMPPGASLAALTMSHAVSDRPLEVHVFLNLLHQLDFYVATSDKGVWKIHKGKVSKIQ